MSTLPSQLHSILTANNDVYRESLPENCIRIMRLYPGHLEDDISCDLSVVKLGDVQSFHALSYCWGHDQAERAISCNGEEFKVTRNLYAALKQLRLLSETRHLWIDAVCVNQNSIAERNAQVPIMAQIYEKATRVIVWLGEEDKTTDLALAAIRDIWAACCSGLDDTADHKDRLDVSKNEERVWQLLRANITNVVPRHWRHNAEACAQALLAFFSRPWFFRIWVIQEVRGCRDIQMQIDNRTIPWSQVALTAAWVVYAPSSVTRINEPYKFGGFLHADLMWQRLLTTKDDVPFLEVLDRCRSFKCTIDKDRIFALLQHPAAHLRGNGEEFESGTKIMYPRRSDTECQSSHFQIKVDYNVTLIELYRQIALSSIAEGCSLQVLSHAHENAIHRTGYPTWMPVWHTTSSRFTGPRRTFLYNASRNSKPQFRIFPDPSLLGLRGLHCGKIGEVSTNVRFNSRTSQLTTGGIQYGTSLREIWEISRLIVRDCWQPEDNWFQESMCRADSQLHLHFQDFCAFISERLQDTLGPLLLSLHGKWCNVCMKRHVVSPAADVTEMLYILHCETCFDFDMCKSCYIAGHRCPGEHNLSPRPIPSIMCHVDEQTSSYLKSTNEVGNSRRFDLGVRQSFDRQSFFRLNDRYLGVGPDMVQPGDIVVVFFGSRVPFVLRQQNNHFFIVGECYVQGLMDGEAIDAGHEVKLEAQMFTLA